MRDYIDLKKVEINEDASKQKLSDNTLRLRPHFIFNSLMSIYYLCEKNTKKAQQTTLDFLTYLRRSLSSLSADDLIPFADELEHARAYLGVEANRVEDKLFYEFDTPVINFKVPPLTLQPLLEMAVLHGVDPELSPLHIRLSSAELAGEYQIIIEDDGPKYEPSAENDPLLSLDNMRDRLKKMADSSLEINPRNGSGTSIVIHVPKQ